MLPKFDVVESWDDSGDVVIYFRDTISEQTKDIVKRELQREFRSMPKYKRNVYHLEELVGDIFKRIQ